MNNKKFEINSLFKVDEKSLSADGDVLTIKGYANTVSKDRSGDVIVKEAWEKGGMDDYLKNPIILAFHDYSRPVGQTVDYNVTDKGLEIVAEISSAAGEVYNLIKDGVLKTFSVGFSIKDADYESNSDTFYIKDLELYEISVVSVPANQDSTFSLAKSFTDVSEYNTFKKSFAHEDEKEDNTKEIEKNPSQDIIKELNMNEKELQEMMAKTAANAVESYKSEVAEKDAQATAEANLKALEMGKTQAEKVSEELEAKIKADNDQHAKAVAEMSDELKAAKDELAAMAKSKMQFSEVGADAPSADELNEVFIASKILGKGIDQLDAGKRLIEKATRFSDTDWETSWNSEIFTGIQNRVVVEPVFNTIAMNARVMNFPFNPDTGADATWVATSAYNDGDNVGTAFNDASSGTTQAHGLTEVTMTAHKLATREYLGYEEEEDALIPVAGIIRDAIIRRMARTSDASILGTGIVAPFTELEELAGGNASNNVETGGTTDLLVASELLTARKNMGQWGMNSADLVAFLSQEAYYNLVDDTNVTTVDKYGDNATIRSGELGKLWGMPLIVSDAFEATGAGKAQAIIVNPSNYLIGNYKGLTLETATDVVAQQKAMVATRRFGFIAKEAGAAGKASMALVKSTAA